MTTVLAILCILLAGALAVMGGYLVRSRREVVRLETVNKDVHLRLRKRQRVITKLRDQIEILTEEMGEQSSFFEKEKRYYEEYQEELIQTRTAALGHLERVLEERSFLPNYKPHRLMVA